MMVLRRLQISMIALAALLLLSGGAVAESANRITPDMVTAALQRQGYEVESITRTILGRARIIASRGEIWREVVLDLSTGQILRDYAVELTPSDTPQRRSDTMPRSGTVVDPDRLQTFRN